MTDVESIRKTIDAITDTERKDELIGQLVRDHIEEANGEDLETYRYLISEVNDSEVKDELLELLANCQIERGSIAVSAERPNIGNDARRARYCANCGGEVLREKSHPITEAIAKDLGEYLFGACVVVGLAGAVIYGIHKESEERRLERDRIKSGYVLHVGDINRSGGLDDQFYLIDGKPAVVELDGKPVVNSPDLDKVLTSE